MRYFMDQPVSERADSRPGHDKRDGRSDRRRPVVAMVFFPLPREEGGAHARRKIAMEGAAITSDKGVRGSSRGLRRPEQGDFSHAFPPGSSTTGVAHEPRSRMPDSTSKC
jgi:hypothetical protein